MKKIIIIVSLSLMLVIILSISLYLRHKENLVNVEDKKKMINKISAHYNELVKTNKESKIYQLKNDQFIEVGKIGKDVELVLEKVEITDKTRFFTIKDFEQAFFIRYSDVDKIASASVLNERYKSYIPFNENIITKEKTNFYQGEKLLYSIDQSFELPIYIKDVDRYYVEYNNQLLAILKSDVEKIVNKENSKDPKAESITTIAYHFIYDPLKGEKCDQIICHTKDQFTSHLDYIKNNHYFTPTMQEFEWFIDGKINLPPKSVVITIDDGWYGYLGTKLLTEYQLNGTIFLITSAYTPSGFASDYVETHSHSHDMHTQGVCPTGQGGGIQCLPKSQILQDLKTSSEILNSNIFCYPFYEFNDYSIEVLKEAGFKMAFGGSYAGGKAKMPIGGDKYRIPRFTMISSSTVQYLESVLKS